MPLGDKGREGAVTKTRRVVISGNVAGGGKVQQVAQVFMGEWP